MGEGKGCGGWAGGPNFTGVINLLVIPTGVGEGQRACHPVEAGRGGGGEGPVFRPSQTRSQTRSLTRMRGATRGAVRLGRSDAKGPPSNEAMERNVRRQPRRRKDPGPSGPSGAAARKRAFIGGRSRATLLPLHSDKAVRYNTVDIIHKTLVEN